MTEETDQTEKPDPVPTAVELAVSGAALLLIVLLAAW